MQKNSQFRAVLFFIYFPLICLFAGFAIAEGSVPSLFVFGDSLVDVGNNNYLSLSISKGNYPHNGIDFPAKKPTGRFCNGKIAADLLAEKLHLPLPPPYLSLKSEVNNSAIFTGVSFGSGAAGIFNGSGKIFGERITLSQQIQDYISIHNELVNQLQQDTIQNRISKSIFMFVIGNNDLLDYIMYNLRKTINPQQYTVSMATNLKLQLGILYSYGARKFLVLGIGQLGCIPSKRVMNATQKCHEETNLLCSMFNEDLKTMLKQLRQDFNGSLSYSYFDTYKIMQDIIADPAAYELMDVKSACCGRGKLNARMPCLPNSKYCRDRLRYFFWDMFGHPTEATSQILVDHMFGGSSHYSFPLNVEQLISV